MKSFILSICIAALFLVGQVRAEEYTIAPYVVATYKHHTMKHQHKFGAGEFKQSIPGMELVLGAKVYPGIEIEAGSHFTGWGKQGRNKSKIVSNFARVLGGIPFSESSEILVGGGLAMTNFEYIPYGQRGSLVLRKVVPHALVGAKLYFTDWLALRPMLSIEGTKNKTHDKIRSGHAYAAHLGLVTYF